MIMITVRIDIIIMTTTSYGDNVSFSVCMIAVGHCKWAKIIVIVHDYISFWKSLSHYH